MFLIDAFFTSRGKEFQISAPRVGECFTKYFNIRFGNV